MVSNAIDRMEPTARALLAAVLEGSDDAIVSKSLDGTILTWNHAAERLFGHSATEAVGKSISILIPEDRQSEEREIIETVRLGRRYQKLDTVRRGKDGELIDLSLTVVPVRAETGQIVGATKIARDITALRDGERQALLARELNHRIKNLFALATSLVSQSAREATTTAELETILNARLAALARAHDLTLPDLGDVTSEERTTSLLSLLSAILAPYGEAPNARVDVDGDDVELGGRALTSLALLLHELATNAVKYGGLSKPEGRLRVAVSVGSSFVHLAWIERGGPVPALRGGPEGFGSHLERVCLRGLAATLSRRWNPEGLEVDLEIPVDRVRE
ncbi:PAS domain S-box protein [Sphingomonas crusticola]|uniref:PAS domain S-box protein n=1 Tax=Sphingomonas crusticola TaxID=1697973 RepID=UPI000E255675|nr:PAS domain S-box protein [Sphingomonas crusticola]